jgi:DNA-binding transcriptional LysR family regulator
MDRLESLQVLVRVVELGSFSAAAKDVGISPAMVGNHIRALEQTMNGALIVRTTRRQSLTELGQRVLDQARIVLRGVTELEQLGDQPAALSGMLRISAPLAVGRHHVAPALRKLVATHPALVPELRLSDQVEDLVLAGLDLVVRNGPLVGNEASLVARVVAQQALLLVAAPSYLERMGRPRGLDDLKHHKAICYSRHGRPRSWMFPAADGVVQIDPPVVFMSDDAETLVEMAVAGVGIAWVPDWMASGAIARGELERVLPGQRPYVIPTYIIRPAIERPAARVSVAAAFLAEELTASLRSR